MQISLFFLKVGRAVRRVHSLISVLCIAIVIFRIVCVIQCDCLQFVIIGFWIFIIIFKQFHFHLLVGRHDCTIELHTRNFYNKRTTRLPSFAAYMYERREETEKLLRMLLSSLAPRHAWKKFAQDFSFRLNWIFSDDQLRFLSSVSYYFFLN